jgi:hypothetical protein
MLKKALLVICLGGVLVLIYLSVFGARLRPVESLRALVEQNVKPGATPESVRQFLDSKGLDHSPLEREPDASYSGHKYGNSPIIVVLKRNTARTILTREDTYVIFVFSEKDELLRIDIFPVFTGL